MRKTLLISTLFLLTAACHKSVDSPAATIDFGPGDGLSHFDWLAKPSGPQDPTDWVVDASWNAQETALFADLALNLATAQQPDYLGVMLVYPNPGAQSRWIIIGRQRPTPPITEHTAAAVLVDSTYKAVYRLKPIESFRGDFDGVDLEYAQLGLRPGRRYRLYYVLYDKGGLLCKGHGDIRYDQ